MRSITTKLALAFLLVSLGSIIMVAVLASFNTRQEFDDFVFDRNSSEMVTVLSNYYLTAGSWEGIEPDIMPAYDMPMIPSNRQFPIFTLVDQDGMVVVEGPGYSLGQIASTDLVAQGIPIYVDDQVVGTLLVGKETFQANQMESRFISRIGHLFVTIAFSVAGFALILGVLLAYNITRPIHQLTQVTREISQGNLGIQVDVRSRDEIGRLAASFNKMSADLERSNQARKQMTADIAHELRTPLSLIIGQSEAVHDGVLPPTIENFEIIREEACRLERLVDDLRILSLADAGELSMNTQPVSPEKLIQEVVSMYGTLLKENQITLKQELDPGLPYILVDPGRMTQVLSNILDNAIHFTPKEGKIIVSGSLVGEKVELAVQDNGTGVTEIELGRIFDRLYRADASRQNDHSGSGLGLAIARSIVEMHNGQIQARIPAEGGLRISILLPVA